MTGYLLDGNASPRRRPRDAGASSKLTSPTGTARSASACTCGVPRRRCRRATASTRSPSSARRVTFSSTVERRRVGKGLFRAVGLQYRGAPGQHCFGRAFRVNPHVRVDTVDRRHQLQGRIEVEHRPARISAPRARRHRRRGDGRDEQSRLGRVTDPAPCVAAVDGRRGAARQCQRERHARRVDVVETLQARRFEVDRLPLSSTRQRRACGSR